MYIFSVLAKYALLYGQPCGKEKNTKMSRSSKFNKVHEFQTSVYPGTIYFIQESYLKKFHLIPLISVLSNLGLFKQTKKLFPIIFI